MQERGVWRRDAGGWDPLEWGWERLLANWAGVRVSGPPHDSPNLAAEPGYRASALLGGREPGQSETASRGGVIAGDALEARLASSMHPGRFSLGRLGAVAMANALSLVTAYLLAGDGSAVAMVGFVLAIIATSWLGGRMLGLAAVALATWGANYLVFSPGTLDVRYPEDLLRLSSFATVALLVSTINSRRAALERSEHLRAVAERDREWVEALLDQGLAPVLLFQPETQELVFANQAARELAGGRCPMLPRVPLEPGESFTSLGRPLLRENWPVVRAAQGETASAVRLEWHLPEGTRKLLVSARRLSPGGDRPGMVLVSYQDFTEAELSAEALRRSEALYETLAEAAPVGIFHIDAGGQLLYANLRAAELLGLAENLDTFSIEQLLPEGGEVEEGMLEGRALSFERLVGDQEGRKRWLSISLSPLRDSEQAVSYVGTADDLTQRKQVEQELLSLSEQRAELVTTVSHALRGPIAAMLANLEVLQDTGDRLSPSERRLVENAVRSSLNLSETVDDLLSLSALQEGGNRLSVMTCSVPDVLSQVYSRMLPRALSRDLALELQVAAAPPVHTDPRHLEILLTELVENALKYTPQGGRVVLSAVAENGGVQVSVRDNGPGLPPAEIPHLFQPFVRGAAAERSQVNGTGLGLAIAARTAALLGFTLEASNRPEGGAAFQVFIPGAAPPGSPALPAPTIREAAESL